MRLAACAALILALLVPAAAFGAEPPRLVLVVVVDQMTAGQLERLAPRFRGALRTLLDAGAVFTEAHHRHVPTQTAVGHAAIMTGRMPASHGIVANRWWDRSQGRLVNAHDDALHGIGPEQLLSYTLGDALKARHPGSIVVSASLKERAAMMMAGKKADAALWLDEDKAAFATSSYYGAAPAWLEGFNLRLHAAGGRLEDVKTARSLENLWSSPEAHRLLEDLARELLRDYPLGRDSSPDLLALGFSGTDDVGHRHGPDSKEIDENLLALDEVLGRILSDILVRVPKEQLLVLFTSDHGVMPLPESRLGKGLGLHRIDPKKFEAQVESALQLIYPAPQGKLVEHLWLPHLYLNRSLAETRGFDWPLLLRDAAKSILSLDGVAEVFTAERLSATEDVRVSSSAYAGVYRASFHPARSGDLLIRPKEDFLFSRDGTTHSTPYRYDTHVPLIFWGKGVAAGTRPGQVRVTDAAPTLAVLLGVDLPPDKGGRVLAEALR
ncbi:MAG: alkaline phosphatase family protein [Elusimicrobia bacterium]|nr:alkaline phosphatase family protein [Elusimicrobiota bacterium]